MSGSADKLLLGKSFQELRSLVDSLGEPAYRATQLFEALYAQRHAGLSEFSTLPEEMRQALIDEGVAVGIPSIGKRFVSKDGTVRYLLTLEDGQSVEAVWMPEGDNGEAGDGSEAG